MGPADRACLDNGDLGFDGSWFGVRLQLGPALAAENLDWMPWPDRAFAFRPGARPPSRRATRTTERGPGRFDLASSQTRLAICPSIPNHRAPASRHRG